MKKMMKLPYVLLCSISVLIFAFSCNTSSTVVTGIWQKPEVQKEFNNVLVAALVSGTGMKATIESQIEEHLQDEGIEASQSIDLLPPKFIEDENQKQKILNTIQTDGFDAILTVSVLDKDTETRYIPGSAAYAPYPYYPYYGSFWGYYNHWYPQFYSPGYYSEEKVYFIETNLYDAQTEDLIWSAQSQTYNPVDLETFSENFADEVVDRLTDNGIL